MVATGVRCDDCRAPSRSARDDPRRQAAARRRPRPPPAGGGSGPTPHRTRGSPRPARPSGASSTFPCARRTTDPGCPAPSRAGRPRRPSALGGSCPGQHPALDGPSAAGRIGPRHIPTADRPGRLRSAQGHPRTPSAVSLPGRDEGPRPGCRLVRRRRGGPGCSRAEPQGKLKGVIVVLLAHSSYQPPAGRAGGQPPGGGNGSLGTPRVTNLGPHRLDRQARPPC